MVRKRILLFVNVGVILLLLLIDIFYTLHNNDCLEKNKDVQNAADRFLQEESNYPLIVLHNIDLGLRGYVIADSNKVSFLKPFDLAIRDKDSLLMIMEKSLLKLHYPIDKFYKLRDILNVYTDFCLLLKSDFDKANPRFQAEFVQDKGYQVWREFQVFSKDSKQFLSDLKLKSEYDYNKALLQNYYIKILILLLGIPTLGYTIYKTSKYYTLSEKLAVMEKEQLQLLEKLNVQLKENLKERIHEISIQHQRLLIQQEEIRQKSEELYQSNQMKNQFLAIISHDLRGPITSLKGAIQLIQEGLISPRETEILSNHFNEKINTTLDLLDNLLYWVINQKEGYNTKRQPIDLHEAINENLQFMKQRACKKDISLVNKAKRSLWVETDKSIVHITLRNLLSNAIKFTRKGGHVIITADNLNNKLSITVKDNGVGISEASQKKLFNLIERFSMEGTNREKGSGLGLAICQHLVNNLKGSIHLESELEKGSSFHVHIPIE